MFLHVFRHVEAQQFHTQRIGQLFCHFGFAHAGWPREQVVADGFLRLAQTRPRQFDRRGEGFDGVVLTENHPFQRPFQVFQHGSVVFRHVFRRDAGDLGHDGLDLLGADGFAPLVGDNQMLRGTGFVDDVDGAVGQFAVVDVPAGQFHRGLDRIRGVFHRMVILEIGLQSPQDLHRIFDRRFTDVDFLEPARQGAVLFEMLAEFLVGGRPHGAQFAPLKRGLQQV